MSIEIKDTPIAQEILDFLTSFLSTLIEHYQGSILLLIVMGWFFIPAFTNRLTKARERAALINKNIDNIEKIFDEMNKLATEQFKLEEQDNTLYFKLIHCNQKLVLYCNRLEEIDLKFSISQSQIMAIRKYTTNDSIINRYGESTMHRLASEQIELLRRYPQQY